MRATVTIDKEILDELVKETRARSKAKAVNIAIAEYLRKKKVDKIRAMKGKLTFNVLAEGRVPNE